MELNDYEGHVTRLVQSMQEPGARERFLSPDRVVQDLMPGPEFQAQNDRVLRAGMGLGFTIKQLETALKRLERELIKQARAEEKSAKAAAKAQAQAVEGEEAARAVTGLFGGPVSNAQQLVQGYLKTQKVLIKFDGDCYRDGKLVLASELERKMLLAAEAFGLTLGPEKVMSTAGIKLAFEQALHEAREARKAVVWQAIKGLPEGESAVPILTRLRALLEKLCEDPALALAAIAKVIWSVKRQMQRLYIRDAHMLVLFGPQGCGKTELLRCLLRVVDEIGAEASVNELTDDRNFALRQSFLVFVDELAKADKADLNKFKSLITGETISARVLYSHRSQKIPLALTLMGTCDKRLNKLIVDEAGMRRFVEVAMIPRERRETLDWVEDVQNFPWLKLWQAIDHTTQDPLAPFEEAIKQTQEDLRARSNVEAWLEQWSLAANRVYSPMVEAYEPGQFVEFKAQAFYQHDFRSYEETFHPGNYKTSMTAWGSSFKALIDSFRPAAHGWSYRKGHNNTVFYRKDLRQDDAVVPLKPRQTSKAMSVVVPG